MNTQWRDRGHDTASSRRPWAIGWARARRTRRVELQPASRADCKLLPAPRR
jgi:hypothetical protein